MSYRTNFDFIYNFFLNEDECFGGREEESCKTVNCHHHGSCAMKNVSVKDSLKDFDGFDVEGEDDVMMEPYCKCPLGFHGQFCEKAVDVQVNIQTQFNHQIQNKTGLKKCFH